MSSAPTPSVTLLSGMAEIERSAWDALANPGWSGFAHHDHLVQHAATRSNGSDCAERRPYNPFVSWDFLEALESAGTVSGRTGWTPRHAILTESAEPNPAGATITAVMPCYVKSHSQGEYVFDWGWAEGFERAGGRYYPKLQVSVPFTPVTGPRILVAPGPGEAERKRLMAGALVEITRR